MQAVILTGRALTTGLLEVVARGGAPVATTPEALAAVAAAADAAERLAAAQDVYGRTTGVGANRGTRVAPEQRELHNLRILRSHAGGAGRLLSVPEARGAVAVRLNQLLAGGSGGSHRLVEALLDSINAGAVPAMHELGAAGTGDMTAMAELGLTLLGDRLWHLGATTPVRLGRGDGLVLLESNAATLSVASLALCALERQLEQALRVAALSFLGLRGSLEAFAGPVHAARPHPAVVSSAGRLRDLLGAPRYRPPRIQDPFCLRCLPQVHGPARGAAADLRATIEIDLNAAAENPLFALGEDGEVFHHGGFHAAPLSLALDVTRLAVLATAQQSVLRICALDEPDLTGLRPFLAEADDGSSGVLILEYTASSALAAVRTAATPAVTGHAVLSRGLEEHASFASQGALLLRALTDDYLTVLACELVAAARAVRQRPEVLAGVSDELAGFADRALATLPADLADRPLDGDVALARDLLGSAAGTDG